MFPTLLDIARAVLLSRGHVMPVSMHVDMCTIDLYPEAPDTGRIDDSLY
jgi:hypothetical protein